MGMFRTVCGFYCSFVALVGIYFFIILGIMELKGNTHIIQILQINHAEQDKDDPDNYIQPEGGQYDPKDKATAFFITAAIQIIFVVGCYLCGNQSLKADEEEEKARM